MRTEPNVFTDRLKELRGKMPLTIAAEKIGISRIALTRYEKGERTPDIDVLKKIAAFYNVSADYLIGLSDVARSDADLQKISALTGLNEASLNRLSAGNEIMRQAINKLLSGDVVDLIAFYLAGEYTKGFVLPHDPDKMTSDFFDLSELEITTDDQTVEYPFSAVDLVDYAFIQQIIFELQKLKKTGK